MVYADREGHIGYQAPGPDPDPQVRATTAYLPPAGWRPENDWTGDYVPFEGLPNVLDPDEGFVVTANQAVIGPDYPYHLTDDWDQGYRSQRIRDLLERRIEDAGSCRSRTWPSSSSTTRNPIAPVLVPYLLDVDLPRGYYSAGQRLLRRLGLRPARRQRRRRRTSTWSGATCSTLTFHDELPEDVWPDGGDRWMAVVTELLDEPDVAWWDDRDDARGRDPRRHPAPGDARGPRRAHPARRGRGRRLDWGHLHRLDLHRADPGRVGHRAGRVAGQPRAAGRSAAVRPPSTHVGGRRRGVRRRRPRPSMRMVVSLADLDDSRWINLTGVSGHPFNDHYTDQTDLWADGETLPWAFSRDAVEDAAEDTLTLRAAPIPTAG